MQTNELKINKRQIIKDLKHFPVRIEIEIFEKDENQGIFNYIFFWQMSIEKVVRKIS